MVIKNCAVCAKEFVFKKQVNEYTCSNVCKGIRRTKPKIERACARPECDKTFFVKDRDQRFCCRSCSGKVNNLGRFKAPKLCKECQSPLQNRARIYCSHTCQYSIRNRRRWSDEGLVRGEKKRSLIRTTNGRSARLAIADVPIQDIGHNARKMRVVMEQNFCCNKCGLDRWLGEPISLELEHKDGQRNNNMRENLEALCPNCHSQTPTWRGRNNGKKVSDEEMLAAIETTSSLRKALISLGMADKGGNYIRIKRLKDEMVNREIVLAS